MTDAALAQGHATVIGWVNDQPIPKTLLEDRLDALRAGPGAATLPAPNTREGRQLVRWTAHVLFTEHLCAAWARQHDVPIGPPTELDALSAIQLGSITTAAWRTHPAVSAVYRAVVNDHTETPRPVMAEQWHLRLATGPTPQAASAAEPTSIGWTTLADLPPALAAAARTATPQKTTAPPQEPAPPHHQAPLCSPAATDPNPAPPHSPGNVGVDPTAAQSAAGAGAARTPVAAGGAWHVVVVDEVDVRPVAGAPAVPRAGTALRAFARWLDEQRARSVRVAEGFEHPGDPRQPDNTHRH